MTGGDRYSQLVFFNNVANTVSGFSPGNMEFQLVGAPFQDGSASFVGTMLSGGRAPVRLINPDATIGNGAYLRDVLGWARAHGPGSVVDVGAFVRGGVYLVAAAWIVGPAGLLGAAGPAIGAAQAAGIDLAVNVIGGANPAQMAESFGKAAFFRAATSVQSGVGSSASARRAAR